MGTFSTAGKNLLLSSLASVYASLHTGDPGDDGANELAGGDPAYARKALALDPADAGQRQDTAHPSFDVPGGSTVAFVGFWTAATGGTFLGAHDVPNESYAAQGFYTLAAANLSLTD